MALDDITLADGAGTPADHVFEFVSQGNGKVTRADMAADPEEPIHLIIGHQTRKFGSYNGQSHLLRFDWTVLDADGVTPHQANIRVMVDLPDRIRSDTLAKDMAAFVRNALTEARIMALIRGSNE